MGQITRTTNPTGLRQIDRKHFVVRVKDEASGSRVFWVDHFAFEAAKLDSSVRFGCIAHAGSAEQYFDLGPVGDFKRTPSRLRELPTDRPLKFRFIFHRPGEALLIGYTDGVRALDDAGQLGSSLVDIEPADLRGVAWRLILPEGAEAAGEKPNVLVEKSLFPTAVSAANHSWFGVLVMPEVMRQIAMVIARSPSALDDPGSWLAPWAGFLAALGIEPPLGFEEDDTGAHQDWSNDVVTRFAAKGIFKHHLTKALAELEGGQP